MDYNRRSFLKTSAKGGFALAATPGVIFSDQPNKHIKILNPRNRVPLSLIIDDSTCLVNMAHYGIPQFAEVFPENYKQNWRKLPREIPDSFVREFGEWCLDKGVKGKYSVVPYPACTGWVNRFIPGWTKKELQNSLNLIREVIVPNWDIHPEMVSHTRVINLKTGRPYEKASPEYMENWEWSQDKSVDELAAYQAYALRVLKDAGLFCEGLTTPGGYAGRNQENLAISTLQSVRDVYKAEIPHYFRNLYTEKEKSVAPVVKYPSDLDTNNPQCVVSVVGCTGDWFGGWDGLNPGSADKFITEDLKEGRMIEVIDSGEPAIMVCHWPGIYFNGEKTGFNIFKTVVERIHQKYDNVVWMKNSEIARYWAAKELTEISVSENSIVLNAPFASSDFTIEMDGKIINPVVNQNELLKQVSNSKAIGSNSFYSEANRSVLCFHLKKGKNEIRFNS